MNAVTLYQSRLKTAVMISVLLLAGCLQTTWSQDTENRRDQARRAFLARPDGVYSQYCSHCHGSNGKGDGRLWAAELSPAPPDLTSLKSDKEFLVKRIREGSAALGKSNLCPPWERTISAERIERLAQYLISWSGPPAGAGSSAPASAVGAAREPFPWPWVVVITSELGMLGWMSSRRKRSRARPAQDCGARQTT